MTTYDVHIEKGHDTWLWEVPEFGIVAPSRRINDVQKDALRAIGRQRSVQDATMNPAKVHLILEGAVDLQAEAAKGLEQVVLCDIDGTLALHNNRGPFEFDKLETDDINWPVLKALDAFYNMGYGIKLLSGRKEEYREHTERWLESSLVPYDELWMRPAGDNRSDDIIKLELYDRHVRGEYFPWLVLDDRDRCVYLWRLLGLSCWQVADGDF